MQEKVSSFQRQVLASLCGVESKASELGTGNSTLPESRRQVNLYLGNSLPIWNGTRLLFSFLEVLGGFLCVSVHHLDVTISLGCLC